MLRLAATLALVLLAPTVAAQETLADLESPHQHGGVDAKVWDVIVTQEEASKARAVIFRNVVGNPFRLIVYDAQGTEVFSKEGSRGIQTLPALKAGPHKFFADRPASFQVTARALGRDNLTNVSTTLEGAADAYVLSPTKFYDIGFTGNVNVEWWEMTQSQDAFDAPGNRTAKIGSAYVITVRGEEGTAYSLTMTPTEAPVESEETPFTPFALVLLVFVAVALARR